MLEVRSVCSAFPNQRVRSFRAYDIIDIGHSSTSSAIAVLLHVQYYFGLKVIHCNSSLLYANQLSNCLRLILERAGEGNHHSRSENIGAHSLPPSYFTLNYPHLLSITLTTFESFLHSTSVQFTVTRNLAQVAVATQPFPERIHFAHTVQRTEGT